MRNTLLRSLAFAALIATAACQTAAAPTATSAHIVAAISDPARPAADTARDADRKPADMIAFGEVHPGEKIGELIPGGGYMTRILSKAVGPKGHVYLFSGPPRQAAPRNPSSRSSTTRPTTRTSLSSRPTSRHWSRPRSWISSGPHRTITTCITPAATSTSTSPTRR